MTRAWPFLILLLLAPAIAAQAGDAPPFAARYFVDGRLVGANGLPIPGQEIVIEVSGEELATPCAGGHANVTDEWGDFRFCWEHRAIRSGARMNVTAGGARATVALDATFRRAYLPMQDGTTDGIAPPSWETTYHVTGRAWRAGPVEIDGVRMIGEAVPGLPVNLTLATPAGNETQRGITDPYGDFTFTLIAPDALNSSAVVELGGHERTILLDMTFHRTHSPFLLASLSTFPTHVPARAGSGAPGSSTPALPDAAILVGVAAALALAGASWYAWQKR